jgi:hypothetical protein
MSTLRSWLLTVIVCVSIYPQAGCAAGIGTHKAPQDVWSKLAVGETQDLIVELDDSAILAQAEQLNKKNGLQFDDANTIQFKKEQYIAIKADVLSTLPSGMVERLKNYDVLPLMFLRFRSTEALKRLVAHPHVLRVYTDRNEDIFIREKMQ